MQVTENQKVDFFVSVFLYAIMGRSEETENVILEVLTDSYTYEKMREVISDSNDKLTKSVIAVLAGNGSVCNALNHLPGSEKEKMCIIINRLWAEIFEKFS